MGIWVRSYEMKTTVEVSDDLYRRAKAEARSEEHTSELQSPCNLVCRLLLEKKKTTRRAEARRWIRPLEVSAERQAGPLPVGRYARVSQHHSNVDRVSFAVLRTNLFTATSR